MASGSRPRRPSSPSTYPLSAGGVSQPTPLVLPGTAGWPFRVWAGLIIGAYVVKGLASYFSITWHEVQKATVLERVMCSST